MKSLAVKIRNTVPYLQALKGQMATLKAKNTAATSPDELWFLNHPPVFTLGAARDSRTNIIHPDPTIGIVKITRGGNVTYHDQGQLTVYFLFHLTPPERNLHRFLQQIEQSIILTLRTWDLPAIRSKGQTGVFVGPQKIASIGISCKQWTTYHGFSLNFTTNLKNFAKCRPCGLNAEIMANVTDFIPLTKDQFIERYLRVIPQIFGRQILTIHKESNHERGIN